MEPLSGTEQYHFWTFVSCRLIEKQSSSQILLLKNQHIFKVLLLFRKKCLSYKSYRNVPFTHRSSAWVQMMCINYKSKHKEVVVVLKGIEATLPRVDGSVLGFQGHKSKCSWARNQSFSSRSSWVGCVNMSML